MNVTAIPLAENGDNPYLSYHDIGLKIPKRQPQIVIRRRYSGQKKRDNKTNNCQQNTSQKPKDLAKQMRTKKKGGGEFVIVTSELDNCDFETNNVSLIKKKTDCLTFLCRICAIYKYHV